MIKPRLRLALGFTLLEVLVVMVLIGIISSFAVLTVGRNPPQLLTEEGQRLAALITLQQQEALLTGEMRSIQFHTSGYAVYRFHSPQGWQPLEMDDYLVRRNLPADMELQLWVEQRRIALAVVKSNAHSPQVLLLNSGEMTPFSVIFSQAHVTTNTPPYRVTGDALGRLTLDLVDRAYN